MGASSDSWREVRPHSWLPGGQARPGSTIAGWPEGGQASSGHYTYSITESWTHY